MQRVTTPVLYATHHADNTQTYRHVRYKTCGDKHCQTIIPTYRLYIKYATSYNSRPVRYLT